MALRVIIFLNVIDTGIFFSRGNVDREHPIELGQKMKKPTKEYIRGQEIDPGGGGVVESKVNCVQGGVAGPYERPEVTAEEGHPGGEGRRVGGVIERGSNRSPMRVYLEHALGGVQILTRPKRGIYSRPHRVASHTAI